MKQHTFLFAFLCLPICLFAQFTFQTDPAATGNTGQIPAGALNDSWETDHQFLYCGGGAFSPVYGIAIDDCTSGAPVGPGTIIGLVQSDGIPYPGTVTFEERLIAEDDSDLINFGIPYTNACGALGGVRDDSDNTMQGMAPSPVGPGMIDTDQDGNLDYYNGYASPPNGKKAALLFHFSVPVSEFGLFLGDTESRSDGLDGYPAQVVAFEGNTVLGQSTVPTGSINQALCDGDGNTNYDGCGNDETVWVHYLGPPATDLLIVVGEVTSAVGQNSNKISFSGFTLGGFCQSVLPLDLVLFSVDAVNDGVLIRWETAWEQDHAWFVVEHSSDGHTFSAVDRRASKGDSPTGNSYQIRHHPQQYGTQYYRLRLIATNGTVTHSPVKTVYFSKGVSIVRVFPNPVSDLLFFSGAEDILQVRITDSYSRTYLEASLLPNEPLDLSRLARGLYWVIFPGSGLSPVRIVKR